jgi:hypothetical protein
MMRSRAAFNIPPQGQVLFIGAVLDNTRPAIEGRVDMIQAPRSQGDSELQISDAHAFNYTFFNVPAGQHTVKMQTSVSVAGSDTRSGGLIDSFSMVVRHR